MECKKCTKCGAEWMEGLHYWNTGARGSELDLAGLVCNNLKEGETSECINPKRGEEGGVTWEYRRGVIDGAMKEFQRNLQKD